MRVRGLEAWRPFLTVSLTRRNFEKAQSAALDAGGKTKVTWSKGEILFPGRQGAFDYNVCAGRMRRKRLPEDRPELGSFCHQAQKECGCILRKGRSPK